MGTAMVKRAGYEPEYLAFIAPQNADWRIQYAPNTYLLDEDGNYVLDENGQAIIIDTFSVGLKSKTDSDATLQNYLANHATLTLINTHSVIMADGIANSLISVNNGLVFDYRIMRYNIEVASGSADGVLDFSTSDAAEYLFELKQENQTGYCKVLAT